MFWIFLQCAKIFIRQLNIDFLQCTNNFVILQLTLNLHIQFFSIFLHRTYIVLPCNLTLNLFISFVLHLIAIREFDANIDEDPKLNYGLNRSLKKVINSLRMENTRIQDSIICVYRFVLFVHFDVYIKGRLQDKRNTIFYNIDVNCYHGYNKWKFFSYYWTNEQQTDKQMENITAILSFQRRNTYVLFFFLLLNIDFGTDYISIDLISWWQNKYMLHNSFCDWYLYEITWPGYK